MPNGYRLSRQQVRLLYKAKRHIGGFVVLLKHEYGTARSLARRKLGEHGHSEDGMNQWFRIGFKGKAELAALDAASRPPA